MRTLLSLPADILIIIAQQLTLPSLLTLRLVHSSLSSLVLQNSTSIAPSVARNTFPDAGRLLRPPSSGQLRDFTWLKSIVYKYVAAVLVDRFRLSSDRILLEPSSIPAESEIGDVLRARVENGWHIMHQLGEITAGNPSPISFKEGIRHDELTPRPTPGRQVEPRNPGSTLDRRTKSCFWTFVDFVVCKQAAKRRNKSNRIRHNAFSQERTTPLAKSDQLKRLEQKIRDYITSLPIESIKDFEITTTLLWTAFLTKHDQPHLHMIGTHRRTSVNLIDDFDWNATLYYELERAKCHNGPSGMCCATMLENHSSWVNSAILQLGPWAFFQQWMPRSDYMTKESYVKEKLIKMWEEAGVEERRHGRELAVMVKKALEERGRQRAFYEDAMEEFNEYKSWELGLQRFHSGESLPRDWMDGIPFFINFKPDDARTGRNIMAEDGGGGRSLV